MEGLLTAEITVFRTLDRHTTSGAGDLPEPSTFLGTRD